MSATISHASVRFDVIAPIAEYVYQVSEATGWQLLEGDAYVRARDSERIRDLFRGKRCGERSSNAVRSQLSKR